MFSFIVEGKKYKKYVEILESYQDFLNPSYELFFNDLSFQAF